MFWFEHLPLLQPPHFLHKIGVLTPQSIAARFRGHHSHHRLCWHSREEGTEWATLLLEAHHSSSCLHGQLGTSSISNITHLSRCIWILKENTSRQGNFQVSHWWRLLGFILPWPSYHRSFLHKVIPLKKSGQLYVNYSSVCIWISLSFNWFEPTESHTFSLWGQANLESS